MVVRRAARDVALPLAGLVHTLPGTHVAIFLVEGKRNGAVEEVPSAAIIHELGRRCKAEDKCSIIRTSIIYDNFNSLNI